MSWNEVFRVASDTRVLSGSYNNANGVSIGSWEIEYYGETVVEYEEVGIDKYNYRGRVYLNITKVISPDVLYIRDLYLDSGSANYSKTTLAGFGGSPQIVNYYYGGNEYILSPGNPVSNILMLQCTYNNANMTNLYRFDGSALFSTQTRLCINVINNSTSIQDNVYYGAGNVEVPGIEVGARVLTANDFTDEENPSVTYRILDRSNSTGAYICRDYSNYKSESIDAAQISLSFDGVTPIIPYRDISISSSSTNYTFNLTEEEREILRQNAQGSDTVPIYFLTKTTRTLHYYSWGADHNSYPPVTQDFFFALQRNLTIVGCYPTLSATVKDIKEETIALTGDENTFIRYESMAEYAINATASKGATIVSQSVTCGSKTITGLPYGVIDNVESGTFSFYVTDSRNMGASTSVFKNLVEYVKPTCYQKAEIEIVGETGATIKLIVGGNYFNGSFGAADNTLTLEVRHTDGNDNWGSWTAFNATPTFNGNTYELEVTFSGFDYGKAYIFQSRIIDKLNFVESAQYVVSMKPVFDWSDADFNFNVPVNIDANNLDMHGETVLRHNEIGNNVVLSASNGYIYIRPGGTNNTSGETIIYPNGNVKFNGTVTFADGTTGGGDPLSDLKDYVIETGSEAMGSNGTWYWRKWASGTAEAWGCRNFGNMAVTTTWGNLYRSAIFTQDLPNNVFIRTPDAININIVHSNYGGWICKHEQTAPSADTTGSFIFVRPASATVTPTNIGFYIVGEWK